MSPDTTVTISCDSLDTFEDDAAACVPDPPESLPIILPSKNGITEASASGSHGDPIPTDKSS
jgi:hypothetical protein